MQGLLLPTLSEEEAKEWQTVRAQAEAQGTFFIAWPHHCDVGKKLYTYLDLFWRNQGLPGSWVKAMDVVDESMAITRELGMRSQMEQVPSRKEILKA